MPVAWHAGHLIFVRSHSSTPASNPSAAHLFIMSGSRSSDQLTSPLLIAHVLRPLLRARCTVSTGAESTLCAGNFVCNFLNRFSEGLQFSLQLSDSSRFVQRGRSLVKTT